MVGESWILDVSLSGKLNEMSMVLDFGKVKSQIKRLVDQYVDHRLLIPSQSQHIRFSETQNGYATLDLIRPEKSIHLNCPEEAYCFIDAETITTESVQEHVYHILKSHLPDNVEGLEIVLRPEKIDGAYYHYSHGLKKHDGNCQRIAHGHRSPIELYVDGHRDETLEHSFAQRWKDIYLGSAEDQVSLQTLSLSEHASQCKEDTHYALDTKRHRVTLSLQLLKVKLK
ncbi:NADPH dependent preQ0 reductase [Vibrio variabilis]|uniref:6-carboxy-5,6,7,8-tetrahydropterin synthase n=1 Tax=Vibrio variabilis TaxID=990271 RepID=A0ABQ0JN29_9VIBR|nr:NADPH dependent preQ0 reductase [Vibrio variabilis]